jgi:hypothetical protein
MCGVGFLEENEVAKVQKRVHRSALDGYDWRVDVPFYGKTDVGGDEGESEGRDSRPEENAKKAAQTVFLWVA